MIVMELSRIEIITGMSKFNGLKSALSKAGVRGMTVTQVLGCGIEKGTKEYEVDENYEMELLPCADSGWHLRTKGLPAGRHRS